MNMNFENNRQTVNPYDAALESEVLIETYETILSGARKDMEQLRRELDIVAQFENKPDAIVVPERNRAEIMSILKQVRAQLVQTQEALRMLRKTYESIKAITPPDPNLN